MQIIEDMADKKKLNRAILKINISGQIEVFTSLEKLYNKYPEIKSKKENIVNYLTRKKTDYVSENYKLRRVVVNET